MAGKQGMKKDNSQRWHVAIRLALQGREWKAIAKELEVSENTIWYWRQNPEFQELLAETQEIIIKEVANNYGNYLTKAFQTQCEIMEDEANSAAIRLSAAEILAKQVLDGIEMHDMIKANKKALQTLNELQSQPQEEGDE